jgi:hypothetical protein
MSRLDAIEARAAAATPGPWEVIDLIGSRPLRASVWTTEDGVHDVCLAEETTPADAAFIAAARTDIPALLAVARAARLVKAQCDDMCPSWYDEPCDCGMAALRAALAPLLEPEP